MSIADVLCRVLGFIQEGDWMDCDTHLIFGWEEYLDDTQADFDYKDPDSRKLSQFLAKAGHDAYVRKKSYVPSSDAGERPASALLELLGSAGDKFYEIGVAMDLIGRLRNVIERADKLNVLSVDKPMQGSIQKLFEEAAECYLLGLNRACVMICRAALELALERRVPVVAPHFATIQQPKDKGRLEWQLMACDAGCPGMELCAQKYSNGAG